MIKTNAMRLLDKSRISYEIKEYNITDEEILNQESYGKTAANKLEISEERIFKTLVTKNDKNVINIFCIPVNSKLDLKKAAKISGNKKLEMLQHKEVLPITGYVVGSCSPIGMKKLYNTYIDESALKFDFIGVSGGKKGVEILINSDDLKKETNAIFADLK